MYDSYTHNNNTHNRGMRPGRPHRWGQLGRRFDAREPQVTPPRASRSLSYLNLYIYIYIHNCIPIYLSIDLSIYLSVYIYTHLMYTYKYVCIYVYVYTYICINSCSPGAGYKAAFLKGTTLRGIRVARVGV